VESATPQTVLVVEDFPDTREGLRRVLVAEGYEVAEARDGREALDYLRDKPAPAVVLLDMLMPVLDGWHFLEEFRARGSSIYIPIIVITAVPVISQEWAAANGCAGCLHKPVSMPDLLADIRRVTAA
jgi:CheY-like chemotaxis protein